jgi:hypothetical protein
MTGVHMKKNIKNLAKSDLTKLALMAIASGIMLTNPLSADDYRSSARNRRFDPNQQNAENGMDQNNPNQNVNPYQNQNQNNPNQSQNPSGIAQNTNVDPYLNQSNPYQNQNQNNNQNQYQNQNPSNPYQNPNLNPSMNPTMNPNINQNNTPGQTPGQMPGGNMNPTPGKYANSGCKGNGKCKGTTYPDETNNQYNSGRFVADNDLNTLDDKNQKNKDQLDKDSDKDSLNNYNDNYNSDQMKKQNNSNNNSNWNGKTSNQQNNNLRQNRLSL